MRFFNLDFHVSVIEDVAEQFTALGHSVESHLLSAHHWALGRPRASAGTGPGRRGKVGYKSVNLAQHRGLPDLTAGLARVRTWQAECPELREYDGYIATYPPAFGVLYDGLPGKIIINVPIRYEHRYEHHFTGDPAGWSALNEWLVDGMESGRVALVANNEYDAAYFEWFTGRPATHIASTCAYIDRLTPPWRVRNPKLLAFGEKAGCRAAQAAVREVEYVRDAIPGQYAHAQVAERPGVVWIPYNCSIMSFFEHYRLGIPMFAPTQRFLLELASRGEALTQISFGPSTIGPAYGGRVATLDRTLPDPNAREGIAAWLPLYDFYNTEEFPHVTYFDSWAELRDQVVRTNYGTVSAAMLTHNRVRDQRARTAWQTVLER